MLTVRDCSEQYLAIQGMPALASRLRSLPTRPTSHRMDPGTSLTLCFKRHYLEEEKHIDWVHSYKIQPNIRGISSGRAMNLYAFAS